MRTQYSAIFCSSRGEPAIVDQVFQLRKTIFVDQHGWDLPHYNGREQDAFDTAFTVYCALFQGEQIVGSFRAIRTDHPYLSAWVFPQLAVDVPYPRQRDVWEISRFGVTSDRISADRLSLLNYGLMFYFAEQMGARILVASAEPAYERFLNHLGIRTERFGPPQVVGHTTTGKPIEALAGAIPIAAQQGDRFARLVSTLNKVEITDASYVFGPSRISA